MTKVLKNRVSDLIERHMTLVNLPNKAEMESWEEDLNDLRRDNPDMAERVRAIGLEYLEHGRNEDSETFLNRALDQIFLRKKKSDKRLVRTSSRFISESTILEQILRGGQPAFVQYDCEADEWKIVQSVELESGEQVEPIPVNDNLLESLLLPDGVERYDDVASLRKEMHQLALEVYDPVNNHDLFELIINIALTSWISEWQKSMAERFMPIVVARGPSETGKKRFLTVMRHLTYRSHYALKVTQVPTVFRSLAPWNATLVEDEADIPDSVLYNEKVQFYNARADGVPIPRYSTDTGGTQYFHSFGLTVLATRRPFSDDGLNSRCLVFPTEGTTKPEDYPLLPPKEWVEKAQRLRRKLLYFRLSHLRKGSVPSQLLLPGVRSFRVRESMLMLQGLSDEDPSIMSDVPRIAEDIQRRVISERAESPEGLILNAVYQYHCEEGVVGVRYRDGYKLVKLAGLDGRDGNRESETDVLRAHTVNEKIGKVMSNADIVSYWVGLGQKTLQQHRLAGNGQRMRSVFLVVDPKRLEREFGKYVPDYEPQTLGDVYNDGTNGSGVTQVLLDTQDCTIRTISTGEQGVTPSKEGVNE